MLNYNLFRDRFINGNPIVFDNIPSEQANGYVNDLSKYLRKKYHTTNDFKSFYKQYLLFKKFYIHHTIGNYDYEVLVDILIKENKIDEAIKEWTNLYDDKVNGWNFQTTYSPNNIYRIIYFESLLKKGIINGYYIHKIASKGNQLTEFGKRNLTNVFESINKIIDNETKYSFFELFYENYSFSNNYKKESFPFEYYYQFFKNSIEGEKIWQTYTSDDKLLKSVKTKTGKAFLGFVVFAMEFKASQLLREGENDYRLSIGSKRIGEGWISETELFYKIKSHFNELEVIQHGRPKWLDKQHFDVWIPEINLAIEYQGAQHDRPVDFFGGKDAFKKNQERDKLKKQKCIKNNVSLIEVRPDYDFNELVKQIENIIK